MTTPGLEQLAEHVDRLPSLPEVVNHLTRSLGDERADVDTLVYHVNSDPAIVARLLSAANSVASGLTTRVTSTRQAFLLLGVDRVVAIVLASALTYRYDTRHSDFDARLLWRHSLGAAVCASVLAEQTDFDAEVAFTAALLHDIGQLLMYTANPLSYVQALELRRREGIPLTVAEQRVFGYDHPAAGKLLGSVWQLPEPIIEAIAAHHEPDEIGSEIGNLVHVSEVLSHALDLGELPNNRVPELSDLAFAHIGLSWPRISALFAEIEARYEGLRTALAV